MHRKLETLSLLSATVRRAQSLFIDAAVKAAIMF